MVANFSPGPKYFPGQLARVRGVAVVVTAIRPPNARGVRLYDVITLDGSRHVYTDEPETNLKPDIPLTSSKGDDASIPRYNLGQVVVLFDAETGRKAEALINDVYNGHGGTIFYDAKATEDPAIAFYNIPETAIRPR